MKIFSYDETFQKVISFKETPLTSVDKVEVGQLILYQIKTSIIKRIFRSKSFITTG
jgi:hypothetical protein